VEITLRDGPFNGRKLYKRDGSFDEGTLIHFDGFSYRIEWDSDNFAWIGWCVDNGSI
jgi:hypothetical protein